MCLPLTYVSALTTLIIVNVHHYHDIDRRVPNQRGDHQRGRLGRAFADGRGVDRERVRPDCGLQAGHRDHRERRQRSDPALLAQGVYV